MLCIIAGGKITAIAAAAFTLSWVHSVERVPWEEDWHITPSGLELVEARAKGSGAGMEPAEGAVLRSGWWTWQPKLRPRSSLLLAASGGTPGGWRVCAGDRCVEAGATAGDPVELRACEKPAQ